MARQLSGGAESRVLAEAGDRIHAMLEQDWDRVSKQELRDHRDSLRLVQSEGVFTGSLDCAQ